MSKAKIEILLQLTWFASILVHVSFTLHFFTFTYVFVFYRWDIIAERLGFMLVFGDLVWIPFTFSIQACDHDLKLRYMRDCFSFSVHTGMHCIAVLNFLVKLC